MENTLYIVIPAYNEEEAIESTARVVLEKLEKMILEGKVSENSKILFVDDGSKDNTWEIISKLYEINSFILGIRLSTNMGHQNALLAGLMKAKENADIIISMDCDLQDDVNAMDEMIKKYISGADIVYGVRSKRSSDSFLKRTTAHLFYKIMNFFGAKTVYNHADYRLLSKRAVESLSEFDEVNIFLRGLVPMLGYETDVVFYERKKRNAGKTKYSVSKMVKFAIEGITSCSTAPLSIITWLGILTFFIGIIMTVFSVVGYFQGKTVAGWTSMMCSIWVVGGLLMISMGVVGKYIGKIYLETKHRPKYIIRDELIR